MQPFHCLASIYIMILCQSKTNTHLAIETGTYIVVSGVPSSTPPSVFLSWQVLLKGFPHQRGGQTMTTLLSSLDNKKQAVCLSVEF